MAIKVLLVCGQFDDIKGRPSGYFAKAIKNIKNNNPIVQFVKIINGGSYKELEKLSFSEYDVVMWFADVPDNDKPKIVNHIKEQNKTCLLVTSKNNAGERYKTLDIIERALRTRSNLLVEFKKNDQHYSTASIWDALGNLYLENCLNPIWLINVLIYYCVYIHNSNRVGSKRVGGAKEIPDEKEFFSLARKYAKKFHKLIHAVNTERFVGNLSFRCENGFPSFKEGNFIYVSRRNIDKQSINRSGFVAVRADKLDIVEYFADEGVKPSVDTPIQLRLFRMFPEIRYMIHCHCYVTHSAVLKSLTRKSKEPKNPQSITDISWNECEDEDAEVPIIYPPHSTENIVPCGDIREVIEIEKLNIPKNTEFFEINLVGHGSIVGAKNVEQLKNIAYVTRPVPERIKECGLLDPIRIVTSKDICEVLHISEREWQEGCRDCLLLHKLTDVRPEFNNWEEILVFSVTKTLNFWRIDRGCMEHGILLPDKEKKSILRNTLEDAVKQLVFDIKSQEVLK